MKTYINLETGQFVVVDTDTAINEDMETFPITPAQIVGLIPVATSLLDWLWVKIWGTQAERQARMIWRQARKDSRRAWKLEKMKIILESKKP